MNATRIDGPGTVPHTDQAESTDPTPYLLTGLWLVTAAALVVAPFLTQFRIRTGLQDSAHSADVSVNGWGQWGISLPHHTRVGILFVAIASLLVLAAVAAVAWRRARWPVWLGLSAGTMAVTAGALQLAELDADRSLWETDTWASRTDVTFGPGAWLALVVVASAAVALTLSLLRIRRITGREAQVSTPRAAPTDHWSFALSGLWLAAAIGLAVAPFLTVHRVDHDDTATHIRVDGWDRTTGSLGIPCMVLAVGLAVAAITMMSRRFSTMADRIGLLAGAGAVVVGGFLLLRLEAIFGLEHSPLVASAGPGTWMVLACGVLAAVTGVLVLVRQGRPPAQ